MGYVTEEKQALVATLRDADPDADTLCTDWTTRRLLAHLVQREQNQVHQISDVIAKKPPGEEPRLTGLVEGATTPTGYQDLISRFETGPARWTPMSWAAEQLNLFEYVIHHEDIRRGGTEPVEPRVLPDGQEAALWKQLRTLGRFIYRKAPVGVVLATPAGLSQVVKKGGGVTLTGDPVELALYGSGRRDAAHVEVTGTQGAIALFTEWVHTI
jgi:uncharacterized protein (TIGR03085 family)